MPGRHEFPPTPVGYVARCKHCGKTEEYLDNQRPIVQGQPGSLPLCRDAPNEQPQLGTSWLSDWWAGLWGWLTSFESNKRPRLSINFTKSLALFPAHLPDLEGTCENFVGLTASIQDALAFVAAHVNKESNPMDRVPFGIVSRLARGGKTLFLRQAYNALREAGYNAMLISFNGVFPGFSRRKGESDSEALYRVIVSQLTDVPVDFDSYDGNPDWDSLSEYIGSQPFVLLVDEINALGSRVSALLSSILKKYFIDMKGRCAIVTTHVPLYLTESNVFSSSNTSFRDNYYIALPMGCCDIGQLQAMHPVNVLDRTCSAITPCAAAYYLGMPSLLYTAYLGHSLGEYSFEMRFSRLGLEDKRSSSALADFVSVLLSGDTNAATVTVYHSLGTVDARGKIRFPLCYVYCILKCFQHYSVGFLQRCIESLDSQKSCYKDGKAWETVVSIAMLLRMESSIFHEYVAGPFDMCGIGWAYGAKIHHYKIPCNASSIALARQYIDSFVLRLEPERRHLVWCTPQHQSFEQYDGMAVIVDNDRTIASVVGFQMKEGRTGAGSLPIPAWVNRSIHLRGLAGLACTHTGDWEYKTRTEILDFLGCSLSPLLPGLL